jgi:GT2 family glycosyltransferase
MDLSIIFVNWNSEDYLRNCIASIYSNTKGISFETIVVDNASPAGNVDALKENFPEIKIIKSQENLGFARANNLGFKNSSGSFVLILNPDTKLVGPAVNILLDHSKSLPDAGIVGGRLVDPDLTVQTTSIQRFPTILNQVADVEYLRRRWPNCSLWSLGPLFTQPEKPVKVDVIPGACMLLRREVFEKAGMFTEDYFMYAEDIDLNRKVARLGFSNYFVPDATVIHYGGTSSSHQKINQWSTIMKYRAMDQYYTRNDGRIYAVTYRAAMGCAAVARLLVVAALLPLGMLLRKGRGLWATTAKWTAVLTWAIGLGGRMLNAKGNG